MRFSFSLTTVASPEQVLAAFTDFTDRRPGIWSDTLDPAAYQVSEVGDTWAIVREGSRRPRLWAVERYDWSVPGQVRWSATSSNFCAPGSGIEVTINAHDGGSRVDGAWHRSSQGLKGAVLVPMMRLLLPRMLPKMWKEVLDRYARAGATAG